MASKSLFKSSIGKKFAMALSALFLLIFLLQHFTINLLSVLSPQMFNEVSHFMGYNPIIQFLMQPILGFAVIFHFVMGMVLEVQNNKARPVKYAYNQRSANSSWTSRNMIISGLVILFFLGLHMYDFWVHEMNVKYVNVQPEDATRYWGELHAKFADIWRVIIYVVAFVLLGLHLSHGFQSAFQSVGARHKKYTPVIQTIGKIYSIVIPVGFAIIAIYHFVTQ
ncbi:succinate dehydrogenase cytochrome b subunit [Vaginella massiliensis]|uniref:succinate dehydrogenase cytochrome b subunit n=1 Tax=Vaginella massiliensis TaxID=1816680 RepID=UPI000837BA4C|nr:succinate dehydrogenase cytochrome b subunit [Vaginella massiliensis]